MTDIVDPEADNVYAESPYDDNAIEIVTDDGSEPVGSHEVPV